MLKITRQGNNNVISAYLKKIKNINWKSILNKYGAEGVKRLSEYTPIDTGKTASSWGYEVQKYGDLYKLIFFNNNVVDHVNIACVLQFGHVTNNGGWVEGQDYINPALKPILEKLNDDIWREIQ